MFNKELKKNINIDSNSKEELVINVESNEKNTSLSDDDLDNITGGILTDSKEIVHKPTQSGSTCSNWVCSSCSTSTTRVILTPTIISNTTSIVHKTICSNCNNAATCLYCEFFNSTNKTCSN